jgi:hypothetical protein
MNPEIHHFVLTTDGAIREFTSEQAALLASGSDRLPEFADLRLRYLQVAFEPTSASELRVQTAGGSIRFDHDGRLAEAAPPVGNETITRFEHDTCVQWALRDQLAPAEIVLH